MIEALLCQSILLSSSYTQSSLQSSFIQTKATGFNREVAIRTIVVAPKEETRQLVFQSQQQT